MEEREPFDIDAPDEPEPSTDDVDGELVGGADDDDEPWFDTEGGSDGG